MWSDYDLDNPATWTVMEAPTVERAWEQELTRIGGLNPFGKPNLIWVWGATHVDPMNEDGNLKYLLAKKEAELVGFEFIDEVTGLTLLVKKLEDVPKSVLVATPKYEAQQLGERRIIIEQWRSPEFLARSGRYHANMLRDPDKTYQWFFCKACDVQLFVGNDGPEPCEKCGSKRSYLREIRVEGEGKLLRSFPHEGSYDYFLRLENERGEPLPADANTLRQIESAWYNQKQMTDQVRDAAIDAVLAPQIATNREATNPANPFMVPR